MESTMSHIVEVSGILSQIREMKDQTLDHFFEDKEKAKELLIGLNSLEEDANKLIRDFESVL
jgi:hypothetical protein